MIIETAASIAVFDMKGDLQFCSSYIIADLVVLEEREYVKSYKHTLFICGMKESDITGKTAVMIRSQKSS